MAGEQPCIPWESLSVHSDWISWCISMFAQCGRHWDQSEFCKNREGVKSVEVLTYTYTNSTQITVKWECYNTHLSFKTFYPLKEVADAMSSPLNPIIASSLRGRKPWGSQITVLQVSPSLNTLTETLLSALTQQGPASILVSAASITCHYMVIWLTFSHWAGEGPAKHLAEEAHSTHLWNQYANHKKPPVLTACHPSKYSKYLAPAIKTNMVLALSHWQTSKQAMSIPVLSDMTENWGWEETLPLNKY